MAKVSAIVSAWYAERFLAGRIENLLSQTLVPEVVVVCVPGSIEERISKAYEVTIITVPQSTTIYQAWNVGIKGCSGEYVTNANCDDRLFPRAIEEMAAVLDRSKRTAVVYGNQEVVKTIGGDATKIFDWAEGGAADLMRGCFVGPMPMWRKSLHTTYGYFNEELRIAGDYEFWLRITSCGEKLKHMKAIVGQYLEREESVEHREPLRAAWEQARVRAMYKENVK